MINIGIVLVFISIGALSLFILGCWINIHKSSSASVPMEIEEGWILEKKVHQCAAPKLDIARYARAKGSIWKCKCGKKWYLNYTRPSLASNDYIYYDKWEECIESNER